VAQTYDPSTQEVEAEGWKVQVQPGLNSKSLPVLKNNNNNKKTSKPYPPGGGFETY
jgi:hypothetical protein